MSVIRMVLRHFGNVQSAHLVYLFFSLLCQIFEQLSTVRSCACVLFASYLSFRLSLNSSDEVLIETLEG